MTAIRYAAFPDGRVRKIRLGRWQWTVRDGLTGPVLAQGASLTERLAYWRMGAAVALAEPTGPLIPPMPLDRPRRPLDEWTAAAINGDLAEAGVPVAVQVREDGTVDLWALDPLSTTQEVTALYAVTAETDARVRWHEYAAATR